MNVREVNVAAWSAQLPGLESPADREAWLQRPEPVDPGGKIAAPNILPAYRRRCSRLTKLAVEAGMACCRSADREPSTVAKVMATRHGEIATTARLLETLARDDTPSPTAFINSVHHTAIGYFDLCTGNRQPARAVSGGAGSLGYGFLEGLSLLHREPGRPVLLVAGEDAVPAPFTTMAGGRTHPWAVALLLETAGGTGRSVTMEFLASRQPEPANDDPGVAEVQKDALDFLSWWVSGSTTFTMDGENNRWRWTRR